jgi:hypothetical protein
MRTLVASTTGTILAGLLIGSSLLSGALPTHPPSPSILVSQVIESNPTPPIVQNPTPPIEQNPRPRIEQNPTPPIEKDPKPPVEQNPRPPVEKQ